MEPGEISNIPSPPPGFNLQPPPPPAGFVLQQPISQIQQLTKEPVIQKSKEYLLQQDKDIDYKTGAPVDTRVMLQRASTPEEAKLALERAHGAGNFGQDRFGQWWIKQGDKRVSVLPKGVVGGLENVGTGMLSSSWPMAGAIGGGVVGEALFPLGGGIPGAMAGAAVGKGIDDLIKWAQGVFAQSGKETVKGVVDEATLAGAFQMAGPLAVKAGQAIKGGLQRFTGVTPTTRTMAQDLASGGAVPPIGSYAPEATSVEYKRQLRNILSGDPGEGKNVAYLTSRMDNILAAEGVHPAERQELIKEIQNTSFRTSAREAGEKVTEEARGIRASLLNDAQSTRQRVETELNKSDAALRSAATAPPSTAQDVSQSIREARKQFSKDMSQVYERIDRMVGDQKIVPTASIKAEAKDLVQVMPPNALPPLIKMWAGKDAPKYINFQQAHALRTTLREMSEILDVSPTGQKVGNIRKMAGATNDAIGAAEGAASQQAAQELKRADALYAQGIAKYNNAAINRIVRELRTGIVPEPGYAASLIMNADNPNLAKTVFSLLPKNVQGSVLRADLGNMVTAASRRAEDGSLRMDGQSFLQLLDQRKPLIDAVYDPALSSALRRHAADLAAFDGKIDVTNVKTPTAITTLLERAVGAARAADEFVKGNPIGALASGTPMQVDRALARLTLAGNEAMTDQAARTLGIDSSAWKAVRKYALQRLFAGSTLETQSLGKTVSGQEISRALSRYTKKQQDLLFPGGLADDLRLLAQESKFLFPTQAGPDKNLGTSLAAASIKERLWLNPLAVWKWTRMQVMGYVADHPALLKFLTSEIKRDRVQARSTLGVLGQWLTERALFGGPGSMEPAPAPVVSPSEPAKAQYGGPRE